LVDCYLLDLDEFILQVYKVVVIEGKLPLQGTIRDALVLLQPRDGVG
jgi:hypothetical protein